MAEPTGVTYTELVKVLTDLNYVPDQSRSAETYSIFQHPDHPLPIFLQILPADEPVRNTYLVMVEQILRENDPASAQAFRSRIGGRSAAALQGVPA